MKALVTGAAGFIGSRLSERLLELGDDVRAVDCFTDHYARSIKQSNLATLINRPSFEFVEGDLSEIELGALVDDVEVVYHLAAQPGVRPSWGAEFSHYVRNNITVTQRLLEVLIDRPLRKLVYASSSSVYGNAETYPTTELKRPVPISPYGVTKLAGEQLCELYRESFGVPSVSLRLFTVYGPRQRPDMAFSRLVAAALDETRFHLYGDGEQTRDFTFVADVVRAMSDAALSPWCGVANIGGGSQASLNQVITVIEDLCGTVDVVTDGRRRGDVRHTAADITVATKAFGYRPRTQLVEGLASMIAAARAELVGVPLTLPSAAGLSPSG